MKRHRWGETDERTDEQTCVRGCGWSRAVVVGRPGGYLYTKVEPGKNWATHWRPECDPRKAGKEE